MNKLINHFRAMQAMASAFISPAPYVDRDGVKAVNPSDECGLFSGDMIYMLDGPEQREAQSHIIGQGLDLCFDQTQSLHRLFDTPAPYVPTQQTPDLVERRAGWIESEVQELRDAVTLVDQADAYLDVIVFALGGLVELGVAPGRMYEIVMASQFQKVWDDGKPRVREDGKWMKPPGWVAPEPELEAEVLRQVGLGGFQTTGERENFEADMGLGEPPKNLVPPA